MTVMGTLWTLQSSQPGLSLYSKIPMEYGTSYYIISLSVNIFLTILITLRLLLYRRRIIGTLAPEHGKHYFSLITIVIESAASYSTFALLFIVTYALNNPINIIFLGIASPMQVRFIFQLNSQVNDRQPRVANSGLPYYIPFG